jgi:GNAT superfamily N-acetyltransferase
MAVGPTDAGGNDVGATSKSMAVGPTFRSGVVRPAAAPDAARLAALSGELGYPVDADAMSARLARLAASDRDAVLVAELPGAGVVGWIHAAEQELLESGRRCEILGLVVGVAVRRAGAGRALVAAVDTWAAGRGLREITVRSNVARAESHPFYERLGFIRHKTQHVYRRP